MLRSAAAALAVVIGVLMVPAPARAANVCQNAPAQLPIAKGVPVEDQVYAPKRLNAVGTGRGVRVAVIDSGVAANAPQLRGHVDKGADFLHGDDSGRQDCIGHGTAVASIIAAQPASDTGFQGLAPGVTIVPIRISEQEDIDGKAVGDRGTPKDFAQAIDWAVNNGDVQVINLSLVMTAPNSLVEAAVKRAIAKGVVVVAAAGNHPDVGPKGGRTPYPAAYDGVIGVAATTADGVRATFSQFGTYVDIAAIGQDVTVAANGSGHDTDQGTSFAAPFVSATAALIKQRFPDATPDEVFRRLTATTDPAPGGEDSLEYGKGLLNPYRAVTETLGGPRPPAAPVMMHGDDPATVALTQRRAHSRNMALLFAGVGGGAVLLLGVGALVVQRGRRRAWRPAGQ